MVPLIHGTKVRAHIEAPVGAFRWPSAVLLGLADHWRVDNARSQ